MSSVPAIGSVFKNESPSIALRRERRAHPRLARLREDARTQKAVQAALQLQRQQFAQDLHDDIGGALAVLAHQQDAQAAQIAQAAIVNMRALLACYLEDREAISRRGPQLRSCVATLCEWQSVSLSWLVHDDALAMLSGRQWKELQFVVKEAVNNALKHSRCTRIEAQIQLDGGICSGYVSDNGIGLRQADTAPRSSAQKLGLMGMKARLSKLGGALSAQGTPGMGTQVTWSFAMA
jgi:signal transduction histidine kinase